MMIEASLLLRTTERNYEVLMAQIDGISDAESLLQLPFRGNCMNWVVGHLVAARDRLHLTLGEAAIWPETRRQRYGRDAAPVMDASDSVPFNEIVGAATASYEQLKKRLTTVSKEELSKLAVPYGTTLEAAPVWNWIHFSLWHETYHVGNLELLRQLAGKNDRVL